jgi:hypothetical protein
MEANDYSTKFATMVMQIPNTMYIFDVQKPCGYSEFVLIYKDMLISEMIKVVATQFQDPTIHSLFFVNPETQERHVISIHSLDTVCQLIQQLQNSETMRPAIASAYPSMENFVVYRIHVSDVLLS